MGNLLDGKLESFDPGSFRLPAWNVKIPEHYDPNLSILKKVSWPENASSRCGDTRI
jgi:hypothetical protein